jgi:hypothetical protein
LCVLLQIGAIDICITVATALLTSPMPIATVVAIYINRCVTFANSNPRRRGIRALGIKYSN